MNVSDDILRAIDQGTSSTHIPALSRTETRFERALSVAERDLQISSWRAALRSVRSS